MSTKSTGPLKTLPSLSKKETKKNPSKIAPKNIAPKIKPNLPEKNKVNSGLIKGKNIPQLGTKKAGRPVKNIGSSPVTLKENSKPTTPLKKDNTVPASRGAKGIKKVLSSTENKNPVKKASPGKVAAPTKSAKGAGAVKKKTSQKKPAPKGATANKVPEPEIKTAPSIEKPASLRVFEAPAQQKTLQDAVKLFEQQAKKTQEQYREILTVTSNMKDEIKQLKLPEVFLPEKTSIDPKDIIVDKKVQKYLKELVGKAKRRPTRQSTSLTNSLAKAPVPPRSPFIYKKSEVSVNKAYPAKLTALPEIVQYVPNKVNKNNPLLSEFPLPITDTYVEEIKQLYYHFDIAVLKGDLEVFGYIHDLVQKHHVALLHEAIIFEHFMLFQNSVKHALISLEKDVKDKKLLYPITGTKYNFKVFASCIRDNVKILNNASQQSIKSGDYTEMLSLPQYLTPNEETDFAVIDPNAAIHKFKAYFNQCITYLYYLELR